MFKLLFYLLIIYLVYRYVFKPKMIDRTNTKRQDSLREEGGTSRTKGKDEEGYVDYEELK